jgi:EAL domain-containing protein (putative c-di-GMP-specific phosphodiesterase class I)
MDTLPDRLAAAILRHVNDAVVVVDADNRIVEWTESASRLFRLPADAALARRFGEVLAFAIETSSEEEALTAIRAGQSWRGEGSVRLPDGTELWIESTLGPLSLPGHAGAAVVVSRDMTRQRHDDIARAAAERALRALSRLNRELVREIDERALVEAACRIAVDVGGYRVAWIGYTPDDPAAPLELLASAGIDEASADRPDRAWLGELDGDEPARTAIRTGEAAVRDLAGAGGGPGRDGLVAAAAFPLRNGGRPFGALTVYSDRLEAFSEPEVELLGELSADLAYGISARRTEAAHAVATSQARADELVVAHLRIGLTEAVQQVATDASLEEIANTICKQFVSLPGVDVIGVGGFVSDDEFDVIASAAPEGWPLPRSDSLTADIVKLIRAKAPGGPWVEDADTLRAIGWVEIPSQIAAVAFGPIVHGDHVDGGLALGLSNVELARSLVDRLPAVAAYSATASGLLAERLHDRRRQVERRRQLERVIAARAFHPVFQVLVDLETREPVGYEALTRFDSGEAPDGCFADAWPLGLGPALELATLEAAAAAARTDLPPGVWLNVNVSPRLLLEATELRDILAATGHPVVVEVTEHEVVTDYDGVRNAVRRLGKNVRLAVDDAGAGVANFGHIIELESDFVKLDMSLVRRVNAHLGRQALVVAMRRFALSSGCRLIAEGIETEPEAATLLKLGVEFGQGYLFGAPGEPRGAGRNAGEATSQRRAARRTVNAEPNRTTKR